MSTDFDIVCDKCRKSHHIGQHMAGRFSFAFGTGDPAINEPGSKYSAFVDEHLFCNEGGLRIVNSESPTLQQYQDVTQYSSGGD